MKQSVKTLLNYISVFIIFSGALSLPITYGPDLRFFYFIMIGVVVFWLPALKTISINRNFLVIFSIIVVMAILGIIFGTNTINLFNKQFIGIFANAVFFYMLFRINEFDVKRLFKTYLNIAFLVALTGLFQEASFLLGFRAGYDYSSFLPTWKFSVDPAINLLRVNSILPEATHFCDVMIPALFISLVSLSGNRFGYQGKLKSLIIIISYIFSMSVTGYIAGLFAILLLAYNYKKIRYLVISVVLISLTTVFIYNNVQTIKNKVNNSLEVLAGRESLEAANLSTYALYTNAIVSFHSFLGNPLFGSGLGSHEMSFNKYIGEAVNVEGVYTFLNQKDADSLFLRMMSELGVFGILAFFIFILRFHLQKTDDATGYLWLISNAALTMFFIKLLRNGHYFYEGFFFFFWIYYFTKTRRVFLKNDKELLAGKKALIPEAV